MATDLDSRNGTALNGEPLDRPRRLRDGDTLIVGGHRLEVSDPGAVVVGEEAVWIANNGDGTVSRIEP
jgi:pSer/pThr/pTyr-binding forkhead associated (FHA) protein